MRIFCFVLTVYSCLIFTLCKLSCNGGTPLQAQRIQATVSRTGYFRSAGVDVGGGNVPPICPEVVGEEHGTGRKSIVLKAAARRISYGDAVRGPVLLDYYGTDDNLP